ncbi:hypothetical protein BDZ45DRAFT_732131 [Acephala macrosclerotiorum]|nr:hypothetical protein BDZ45DRAFT_732131 [Acephala macrosclerotiorum]
MASLISTDYTLPGGVVTIARQGVESGVDGVVVPPIINTEVVFDAELKRYVKMDGKTATVNVYEIAEREKEDLLKVMNEFQNAARGSGVKVDFNKYQDWVQVEATMRETESQYKQKHKDRPIIRGFEQFFSNVGDSGGLFQAWLSLLPTGEYSSIVCGAFKLVIKSCIRMAKIRDLILSSLGKIPQALQTAKQYLEMRNLYKSAELHIEFSRLYKAILLVFKHMLEWMSKSGFRHAAKALWQQDDYEMDLEDRIKDVWDRAAAVRQQAEICSQYLIGSIHENLAIRIRVTIEGVETGVDVLIKGQARIENGIQDTLNAFLNLFQDGAKAFISESSEKPMVPKNERLTARDLMKALRCNFEVFNKDISKALKFGRASDSTFQERAQAIMLHPRLKTWVTNATSQMLLINGNGSSEKISPFTLACEMLVQSLESFKGAFSLSFFCGMHIETAQDDKHSELMMTYLIYQLLISSPSLDLTFIRTSLRQQDINDHDIGALCFIFEGLVRQLAEDQIIFCLIDGISFFEYGKREKSTSKALSTIVGLVEECACMFKLLVTSATRSVYVHKSFTKSNILNLRAESMRQTGQGLDVKKFVGKHSASMESLAREWRKQLHPEDYWSLSDSDKNSKEETSSSSEESS